MNIYLHRSVYRVIIFLYLVLFCSIVSAKDGLFEDICLNPGDAQNCYILYTFDFCDWDPSQEKTSNILECFVDAANALNLDIVNCVQDRTAFVGQYSLKYEGASGLAPYRIDYSVLSGSGDAYFTIGAKEAGEEFSSTFIELFIFGTNQPLAIDGAEVSAPNGRILLDEALRHEFWRMFKEGDLLVIGGQTTIELSHLRDFFSLHFTAMESCLVEAPDIFRASQ